MQNLHKAELVTGEEEQKTVLHPGLRMLHTIKLGCIPITDFGMSFLIKVAPNI
jgi:hypothetical protein